MHEAGHGIYEQGLLTEHVGTPMGMAVSLGIHESQSRMWENQVGRSQSFWKWAHPKLKEYFGASVSGLDLDAAYGATVRPREWARLGLLLANGGRAGDREVVSEQAIAAVLEGSRPAPEFALGLWRNPATEGSVHAFYPDGLRDLVVAAGEGNQRLYVIPSLDLVVVRTGDPDRGWRDREFLDCLVQQADEGAEGPQEDFSAPVESSADLSHLSRSSSNGRAMVLAHHPSSRSRIP